jgi:hypothetical protein
MKPIIVKLIPVFLVFFYFAYNKYFLRFSNTILGKLVAISLIVYYTTVNPLYGLFVCALAIALYQSLADDDTSIHIESFVSYSNEYPVETSISNSQNFLTKTEFKKKHCEDGQLTYKGYDIKPEMTEYVYNEIKFQRPETRCNVCDKNCDYIVRKP